LFDAASRTRRDSCMTSGPIPSPDKTDILNSLLLIIVERMDQSLKNATNEISAQDLN